VTNHNPPSLPGWPRLLDTSLAAGYSGVKDQTIRDWIRDGLLIPVPMPGSAIRDKHGKLIASPSERKIAKLLIDREDLDALIDRRKGAAR
jgi:hypothetical protein